MALKILQLWHFGYMFPATEESYAIPTIPTEDTQDDPENPVRGTSNTAGCAWGCSSGCLWPENSCSPANRKGENPVWEANGLRCDPRFGQSKLSTSTNFPRAFEQGKKQLWKRVKCRSGQENSSWFCMQSLICMGTDPSFLETIYWVVLFGQLWVNIPTLDSLFHGLHIGPCLIIWKPTLWWTNIAMENHNF